MENKKEEPGKRKIAVVRVRGSIRVNKKIEETMQSLRLYNNNFCAVIENNEKNLGMLKKAKDYITWGEIDDETYKLLIEKRGEEYKGREQDKKGKIKYKKFILVNGKKYKKFFRLNMPKKGFGRKGIKVPFSKGGALGNRAAKINDLIRRMV